MPPIYVPGRFDRSARFAPDLALLAVLAGALRCHCGAAQVHMHTNLYMTEDEGRVSARRQWVGA